MMTPSTVARRVEELEKRYPPAGDDIGSMSDRELMAELTALRLKAGLPPPEPLLTREQLAAMPTEELVARLAEVRRRQAEAKARPGLDPAGGC